MKAAIKEKVHGVTCQLGKNSLKISLQKDGTVLWTTTKDASNQDDFVKYNLQNILLN